jgi:hypothetical protein
MKMDDDNIDQTILIEVTQWNPITNRWDNLPDESYSRNAWKGNHHITAKDGTKKYYATKFPIYDHIRIPDHFLSKLRAINLQSKCK